MPESIISNTGPLIALMAGMGDLQLLNKLYSKVIVPWEVFQEIHCGGADFFGVTLFDQATFLEILSEPTTAAPYLLATLDRGEASVIQSALYDETRHLSNE